MTGLSVLYTRQAAEEREWAAIPDRDRTGRLREVYWAPSPATKGSAAAPGDPLTPPTRSEPARLSDFRISRLPYPLSDELLDELTELLALV